MNYSRNNSNARKIEKMSEEEKSAYLASGRVTVDYVDQIVDGAIKRFYVAKIRGVVVGNSGEYLRETREAAKEYGDSILATWKQEQS